MSLNSLRSTQENTLLLRATDPVTQSWRTNSRHKSKLDAKYDCTCDVSHYFTALDVPAVITRKQKQI
jgi:hypothetical protein